MKRERDGRQRGEQVAGEGKVWRERGRRKGAAALAPRPPARRIDRHPFDRRGAPGP